MAIKYVKEKFAVLQWLRWLRKDEKSSWTRWQGCAGVMNAESGIYGKIVMNSVVFRNNTTLANTDSGISKSKSKCI